jgi:ribose transport system substrate-binding protein
MHGNSIYTIGFSNLDEKNPFAVQVREHLESQASQHSNLRLIVRDNNMNTPQAIHNVEEFISIPVDLAILFHIDERAGAQLVTPFMKRRIPVICIDVPLFGAIFFGINTRSAGNQVGEALANWVQANWNGRIDKIIVLLESRTLDVFRQRYDYALKKLDEMVGYDKSSLLYLDNGGDQIITAKRVTQAIQNWPNHHRIVILCMNDKIASGALEGIRALGREADVAVASYDGTPVAIQEFQRPNSRLIVSPSFRADIYGQQLIELSRHILSGEKVERAHYVEPLCLTRENYADYVTMPG